MVGVQCDQAAQQQLVGVPPQPPLVEDRQALGLLAQVGGQRRGTVGLTGFDAQPDLREARVAGEATTGPVGSRALRPGVPPAPGRPQQQPYRRARRGFRPGGYAPSRPGRWAETTPRRSGAGLLRSGPAAARSSCEQALSISPRSHATTPDLASITGRNHPPPLLGPASDGSSTSVARRRSAPGRCRHRQGGQRREQLILPRR